ncbi:haloalkane dehalogenase [Paenibacillus typhae]|uniref:haloalkane dehalogenase n=1 Tax=Paenibacillus typhae TaxID=1174501 RepID=UPI001C8EE72D|nr:haloalkane dehalogenase [Paenibacillus typhae]MBY0010748.1 haloalkane dehalogenase [Paenibacillus typhae]
MDNLQPLPLQTGFPYTSRHLTVNGLSLHYVDEGEGPAILLLHGNPTWSYMYRNIIPYLQLFARCIAVDLPGMGRSDKPGHGFTLAEHAAYITGFIRQLGLSNPVLVGHDWGMAVGLEYAAANPDNVRAVAMLEPQALYPTRSWEEFTPAESRELFLTLRDPQQGWPFMRDNNMFVEGMPHIIMNRQLSAGEHEYYREPFRNPDDRKPMWVFPNQIPVAGQPPEVVEAVEARNRWFTGSSLPKLLFYAEPGCTIRGPQVDWCRTNLTNLTLCPIGQGFHHLTEENPQLMGLELQRWFRGLPL